MRPLPLSEAELRAALAELDGWHLEAGKLQREFRFADFLAAFGFMTTVAKAANAADHHPEWTNIYNVVKIALITHDTAAGGPAAITQLDIDLAAACSAAAT